MYNIGVHEYSGMLYYETTGIYLEFIREDIEQLSDVLLNGTDVSVVRLTPDKWDWKYVDESNCFILFDKYSGVRHIFTTDDAYAIMDYMDNNPEEYIACAADFQ